MTSAPSSLVLGFAARLSPTYFEPFIRSLRATGYKGQLGLVLAQYESAEREHLEQMADLSASVDSQYAALGHRPIVKCLRRMRATRGLARAYPTAFSLAQLVSRERTSTDRREALEFALEGLQSLRYKHYYDFLQQAAPHAHEILLVDTRDVVFQGDPFSSPVQRLEVFLEDPSRTLGAEPHNRRWISNLYGPLGLARVENFTASCSGTVMGPRTEILHYLSEMARSLRTWRRPLGSHDQGVHNYLLRDGRFGDPLVVSNGQGRVLTMGGMTEVRRNSGGQILNADGTVPPILHQYDRHPILAQSLTTQLQGTAAQAP